MLGRNLEVVEEKDRHVQAAQDKSVSEKKKKISMGVEPN
jgi:hypothetical protein